MLTSSANPAPTPEQSGQTLHRGINKDPLIIAHQGIQGRYPANSFDAIVSALGYAKGVEFDTYAIPDPASPGKAEVVIIHPEGYFFYVNRAGMKNHEQLPIELDALRKVTVDGRPLVPTLREILDLYKDRCEATGLRTRVEIELKGPDTAEAVVPILQEYLSKGVLSYDDVALCAFCYEGEDRSRLQIARELDPRITLSLSVRGGDFSQDAFTSWDEVFAYARKHNIEWLDVTRRNLTTEVVHLIRENGFKLTCHHLRASDELHDAMSLGVDSIRADMFAGPTAGDYKNLPSVDSGLRSVFKSSGLCRTSDWIWELGNDLKKFASPPPSQQIESVSRGVHASLIVKDDGTTLLTPCENGKVSDHVRDVSSFEVQRSYLSDQERRIHDGAAPLSRILSRSGFVSSVTNHLDLLPQLSSEQLTSARAVLSNLSSDAIIALVEGNSASAFQHITPPLEPNHYSEITALITYGVIRTARLVGAAAVVAARPLENPRGTYTVNVQTPFNGSSIFRNAVIEQVTAQCLRSGNNCNVTFEV